MIREAGLQDYGISTGGRGIADLRYADDTVGLLLVNGSKDPSEALKHLDDARKKEI